MIKRGFALNESMMRVSLTLLILVLAAGCKPESPVCDSPDPQTNVFCKLGYNEVRSEAPIHLHFAEALPSHYPGGDADWEWESWKAGTESLLKDELFPLIGAYEHYYFLIDYEGYNEDDEEIVALCHGKDPSGKIGTDLEAGAHMKNFFECMRDGGRTISDPWTHHRSVSACHLANIAMRLGRELQYDPIKEDFVGDDKASGMLRREQRAKYSIYV